MEEMLCPRCGAKLAKSGYCFKCGARPLIFNGEAKKFHVIVNDNPILTKNGVKYCAVHFNMSLAKPYLYIGGEDSLNFNFTNRYKVDMASNILPLNEKDAFITVEINDDELL